MFFINDKPYKGILRIKKDLHDLILNCVSKDETRPYFMAAWYYWEKKELYATDGKAMVIIPMPDAPSLITGYYLPVKSAGNYFLIPVKPYGTFPNPEKVIPDYSDIEICMSGIMQKNPKKKNCNYWLTHNTKLIADIFEELNCVIDMRYLNMLQYIGAFHIKTKEQNNIVMFYNDYVTFIVMPIAEMKK